MAFGDAVDPGAGVVHPSCWAAGRSRWQAAKMIKVSNDKTTKAIRRVLRFIGYSWPNKALLRAKIVMSRSYHK
jgi:hypothetical protein